MIRLILKKCQSMTCALRATRPFHGYGRLKIIFKFNLITLWCSFIYPKQVKDNPRQELFFYCVIVGASCRGLLLEPSCQLPVFGRWLSGAGCPGLVLRLMRNGCRSRVVRNRLSGGGCRARDSFDCFAGRSSGCYSFLLPVDSTSSMRLFRELLSNELHFLHLPQIFRLKRFKSRVFQVKVCAFLNRLMVFVDKKHQTNLPNNRPVQESGPILNTDL